MGRAIYKRDPAALRSELALGRDPNEVDAQFGAPLERVCGRQRFGRQELEIVLLLLAAGADPEASGGVAGWPPLASLAAWGGERLEAAARALLAAGADPDRLSASGESALELAAMCGQESMARLLMAAPRSPEAAAGGVERAKRAARAAGGGGRDELGLLLVALAEAEEIRRGLAAGDASGRGDSGWL